MHSNGDICTAEVVLPAPDLDATLRFFTERLAFRVDAIIPADHPAVAVVSGYGVRLRLDSAQAPGSGPVSLRLVCRDPDQVGRGERELIAPNGARIELVPAEVPLALPALRPSFTLSRRADATWGEGRAGMQYRDLIPDRQGGRFIASHIRIPGGGPVPDYVHFHQIRFQLIFCYRGWVKVAYEDQGPPFVLRPGDCALQPPRIRHRVLESSPGLEVVEIASPAEHETHADHELDLPTGRLRPDRDFSGQRFVRHVASEAVWTPWPTSGPGKEPACGYEARDLGIASATAGLAGVRVIRPRSDAAATPTRAHSGEFAFLFVLDGEVGLSCAGRAPERLGAGDSVVIPPGLEHALREPSADLEWLEVRLPAD